MSLTGQQLIGYEYSQQGKQTFTGINPRNNEALSPIFHEATKKEVDLAVHKAHDAFKVYRRLSDKQKAQFLEKVAEEILLIGDVLLDTASLETALPTARLQGERSRTIGQLQLFANLLKEGSWVNARIDMAQPDRTPLPKPDIRQMEVPLGPVAIFGASNFPLAFSVAGGDTVSALAAGCPVVFKAHPAHPATCELVGTAILKAAQACQLPDGVFSMVHGLTHEPGMALVTHPLIQAVGFTGSFRGGKAIYDAAVRRNTPIPVYAEMGSTNPVFILPEALAQRKQSLVSGLTGSITLGVGQFCTNPGVIVTENSGESEAFIEMLASSVEGSPSGVMLTAVIKNTYQKGIEHLSMNPDVNVLAGSLPHTSDTEVSSYLLETTAQAAIENPALLEEVFGPSSLHVQARSKEEVLKLAENLQGHLTATIHGTENDLREYAELIDILTQKVGRIIINGYPTGVEVTHAMTHGGPFPATTDSRSTSVGTNAIYRFVRPVSFQDLPQFLLPEALRDTNPLGIWRMVNGEYKK